MQDKSSYPLFSHGTGQRIPTLYGDSSSIFTILPKHWYFQTITHASRAFVRKETNTLTPFQRWRQGSAAGGLRPTELYYSRVLPALKAHGLPENTPRKEWPASLLRGVYEGLARDTPSNIVANELLAAAHGSADWWEVGALYNGSRLMSIDWWEVLTGWWPYNPIRNNCSRYNWETKVPRRFGTFVHLWLKWNDSFICKSCGTSVHIVCAADHIVTV
jgi:hypothetical protein